MNKQAYKLDHNQLKYKGQTVYEKHDDTIYVVKRKKTSQNLLNLAWLFMSVMFLSFFIYRYIVEISLAQSTLQPHPESQHMLINKNFSLTSSQQLSASTSEHVRTLQALRMHNILRQKQTPVTHSEKQENVNKTELDKDEDAHEANSIKRLITKWESEISASTNN